MFDIDSGKTERSEKDESRQSFIQFKVWVQLPSLMMMMVTLSECSMDPQHYLGRGTLPELGKYLCKVSFFYQCQNSMYIVVHRQRPDQGSKVAGLLVVVQNDSDLLLAYPPVHIPWTSGIQRRDLSSISSLGQWDARGHRYHKHWGCVLTAFIVHPNVPPRGLGANGKGDVDVLDDRIHCG